MSRRRSLLTVVALATLVAAPRLAGANGRPAATVDVRFQPGSLDVMYTQMTWGLVKSIDGGATWRWMCEAAIGYGGIYDPDYAVAEDGTIYATTYDGLQVSRDGCTFALSPLADLAVTVVEIAPDGTVFTASAPTDTSKVFHSIDDGASFQPIADLGISSWWASLEIAPSSTAPNLRLYLSGFRYRDDLPKELLLYRSDDSGATWQPLPVTDFVVSDVSDLEIAAVSPVDPDLVFARITRVNGSSGTGIYRSTNAGANWTLVKDFPTDTAQGVVVRQGGARNSETVLIGSKVSGVFKSVDSGKTFTELTDAAHTPHITCLRERADGELFTCGNDIRSDNLSVGRSQDALTWTKVFVWGDLRGPVACAEGTVQHDDCQVKQWCGNVKDYMITANELDCSTPDAGVDAPPADAGQPIDGGGGSCICSSGSPGAAAGLALLVAGLLVRPTRSSRRRGS